MVIPVHRRLLDRFDPLFPGLKTAPFEGKGAQRFPPRLNQIEIRRILRLKDKLPPRVVETKQPHVGRPMDIEVIHNRREALVLCRPPLLNVAKEIHPVGDRAAAIIFGQRLTRCRTKRAKDISLTTAAIVNLLDGALGYPLKAGHSMMSVT